MTTEPTSGDDYLAVEAPTLRETPEEIEYEMRSAEGAMWTGGRLVIGIGAFAFACLAFAYFYLRSANSENLWRPHGVTAPTWTGGAIFAVVLAGALLNYYGTMRLQRGEALDWQVAGWTTVLAGLLAIGLQVWQLTQLPFFPGSSGYASCFIAWAIMNIALLLAGIYWLETLLARWIRLQRAISDDGGAATSTLPVARLFRTNLEACSYFWGFIALMSVFFWLLFYVI
jgi:heme/copper-type cytochrome/quinol oxidase subunit 3